jgi:predicted acetyltransferase
MIGPADPHTMSPPLVISRIGPESDALLRNLFEHYCHDMSEWFDVDTTADGSYSYDTSAIWANRDGAYLAKVGDSIAGFALVGSAGGWLGSTRGNDIHEFFVLRKFRRRGVGRQMAALVWNEHPGEWLVRVSEANASAVLFWRVTVSNFSFGAFHEEPRIVNGQSWRFFRFVCPTLLNPK